MRPYSNEKRARSDSFEEISLGVENALESKYYRYVVMYVHHLREDRLISADMHEQILANGTIDNIVTKKKLLGLKNIHLSHFEQNIFRSYMKQQYNDEINTWIDIVSPYMRNTHLVEKQCVPCHKLCDDLVNYIIAFI